MARGEPPRSSPPLPAPYRNPWRGLAEALRAVAADLRLALQRLWRRNREGDLPRPGFWPGDLAPLFWPLLLSLALFLLLALAVGILQGTRHSGGAPAAGGPRPLHQAAVPGGPGRAASGEAPADPAAIQADTDGDTSPGAPAAATLRLDPLLELLSQGEGAGLLLAARPDPGGSRLSLTLSDAAADLPEAELLGWAERWQQRARAEGYERLELRDRQGRLRGRGALVGSGMILLAPLPAS